MGHPPPGKGERIENIITGSSRGRATLSRAAALKTRDSRPKRTLLLPLTPSLSSHLRGKRKRSRVPDLFPTVEWSPPRRGGSFFHRYCAPLRIARIRTHTPISYVVEHWKGEVGDWKLARNFLLVNTRNFFPPLSLPLNGIDDVVKAYYYLEDGEDNIFIDDNKFYFLFSSSVLKIF